MPLLKKKEDFFLEWTIKKVSGIEKFQNQTKLVLGPEHTEGFQVQNQQNSQNEKEETAASGVGTAEPWRLPLLMLHFIVQIVVKYQLRRCTPS